MFMVKKSTGFICVQSFDYISLYLYYKFVGCTFVSKSDLRTPQTLILHEQRLFNKSLNVSDLFVRKRSFLQTKESKISLREYYFIDAQKRGREKNVCEIKKRDS